jgi:GH25 family lysozyme M1 (1,4-beta-N-acetylmuramidase)
LKSAWIFWPKKSSASDDDKAKEGEIKLDLTREQYDAAGEGDNTPVKEVLSVKAKGTEIVDISKWQGGIDFKALAKKVAFVIARASCGSDKDIKFDEYAKSMKENGIPFGVYCYSYAGTVEKAKDEAQKLVKYAKKYEPLFYVLDAEESKLTKETIAAFVAELKKQRVKKTGCYVAHNHYKDYQYDSLRDSFDFTWIPRYGNNDGTAAGSTKPSYKCDLWQFTSRGKIDGIKGNTDMNIITGDGHDLKWFIS